MKATALSRNNQRWISNAARVARRSKNDNDVPSHQEDEIEREPTETKQTASNLVPVKDRPLRQMDSTTLIEVDASIDDITVILLMCQKLIVPLGSPGDIDTVIEQLIEPGIIVDIRLNQ